MKRRDFLLASSSIAALATQARGATPCPPPQISFGNNSAVSAVCPLSAGNSALSSVAASLSSGSWANLSMGGMGASLLTGGGSSSITEFAARGHWDPAHKKIQYWGQDHNGTFERLITFDEAANQWSAGSGAGFSLGHAYYHMALDTSTGDVYVRGYNSAEVRKKSYGGSWSNIASMNNSGRQVAGGLEWFPGLNGGAGGLVFCDEISAETWNPSTNSWTQRSTSLSLGPYHNWIAAAAGAVYFGGGNGSSAMYRMSANGSVSSAPSTPISAGIGAGIVISHPDGNQLLLFSQGSSGTVYRFNGSSWVTHGSHQIGGMTNYWFLVPLPASGVVLSVAQTSSSGNPSVRLYKP
jgi:hypothetical protein